MNNKGFTLIEVLGALVIISIAMVVVFRQISSTLSIGNNEAYKLMKNNIISVSEDYVRESESGTNNTDFSFDTNNTFTAEKLEKYGYFSNLKSPIDGKYLGDCLIITATKNNGNILIDLEDNCY